MNELQLNDAEFALLIAISIFSAGAEEAQEGKLERLKPERAAGAHRARIVGVEALAVFLGDGRGWAGQVPISGVVIWSMEIRPWPDLPLNSVGDL